MDSFNHHLSPRQRWGALAALAAALLTFHATAAADETPAAHLVSGVYHGWDGAEIRLEPVGGRIGVTFEWPPSGAEVQAFADETDALAMPPDLPGDALISGDRLRARTFIYDTAEPLGDTELAEALRHIHGLDGVAAVHPVFASSSGRESLLTDYFFVSFPADTPAAEIRTLFEEHNLEVVQQRSFSHLDQTGYRLRVTPEAWEAQGGAIAFTNWFHEEGRAAVATPIFAPLYPISGGGFDRGLPEEAEDSAADEAAPESYAMNFQPVAQDEDRLWWHLRQMRIRQAWELLFPGGDNEEDNPGGITGILDFWDDFPFTESPRPLVAVVDGGAYFNYAGRWEEVDGGSYYFAGANYGGDYVDQENGSLYIGGHPNVRHAQWLNPPRPDGPQAGNTVTLTPNDSFGWDFVGAGPYTYQFPGDRVPYPDLYFSADTDFLGGDTTRVGRGTVIAGLAAGRPHRFSPEEAAWLAEYFPEWDGPGLEDWLTSGAAPHARVMPVRFHFNLPPLREEQNYWADMYVLTRAADAIRYTAEAGADVAVLSLAVDTYCAGVHLAIQDARAAGTLFMTGAGNYNQSLDEHPLYPQVWPEVLAVGAVMPLTLDGEDTPQEVRAAFTDRRAHPAIADNPAHPRYMASAYGAAVALTAPIGPSWGHNGKDMTHVLGTGRPGEFWPVSGTASAVGVAAGAASLVLTANPELTPDEVTAILTETAVDLSYETDLHGFEEQAASGRDPYTGHGRIDAEAAVRRALETRQEAEDAEE